MKKRDLAILNDFTILYLEDNENLLKHTQEILGDFLKNVYAVKSSKEAWKVLEKEKVDVIISDILLKDENGIDFLNELKSQNIDKPIILTTAHTDTKYFLDAIKLKVENYIVKPINIQELLDTRLFYTSPSPRDATPPCMPSSAWQKKRDSHPLSLLHTA